MYMYVCFCLALGNIILGCQEIHVMLMPPHNEEVFCDVIFYEFEDNGFGSYTSSMA